MTEKPKSASEIMTADDNPRIFDAAQATILEEEPITKNCRRKAA